MTEYPLNYESEFKLARVAYESYMQILGEAIPLDSQNFADLPLTIQAAWIASTNKVRELVLGEDFLDE